MKEPTRRIEFMPVKELTAQVGDVPAGTHMELMGDFVVKPDGKWCLARIEGVPMPGFDAEGNPEGGYDDERAAPTGEFSKRYHEAMGQEMGGAYG